MFQIELDLCRAIELDGVLLKKIYFVRHGENKANLTREFSYKKVDYSLTEKGRRQAEATAKHLKGRGICTIFSSPLKRAFETAEIIAKQLNLDIIVMEEFREINVGKLEDREPTEENWKLHDRILKDWREGKVGSRFPEGESYVELLNRVENGLVKVLITSENCANILIVSHGGILLATMNDICENAKDFDLRTLENCSITIAELREEPTGKIAGKILSWQDCNHLCGESLTTMK